MSDALREVSRQASAARRATIARDAAIAAARANGDTYRVIARAAELSESAIRKIASRGAPDPSR